MAAIGVHPLGVQLFNPSLIVKLYTGCPAVREIPDLAKVRERLGNFVEGQGKK